MQPPAAVPIPCPGPAVTPSHPPILRHRPGRRAGGLRGGAVWGTGAARGRASVLDGGPGLLGVLLGQAEVAHAVRAQHLAEVLAGTLHGHAVAEQSVRQTGPTIGAAGVILGGSFAALTAAENHVLAVLGFALAIGMFIAAFVMATIFTPAVSALLGRRVVGGGTPLHQPPPEAAADLPSHSGG
ncbi:MMPL family transporter [Actinomadura macra]|uniref:MMPL family transporter n=1 Tax=Actinomadura macra TaxID=46164 RepID=UPI0012FA9836